MTKVGLKVNATIYWKCENWHWGWKFVGGKEKSLVKQVREIVDDDDDDDIHDVNTLSVERRKAL